MNQLSQNIETLHQFGNYLLQLPVELQEIISLAEQHNGWFDKKNSHLALKEMATTYCNKQILTEFIKPYSIPVQSPKLVAVILAGNIPAVGFHDVLCVLLSGHKAKVKLSSKDNKLMKALLLKLKNMSVDFDQRIDIVEERLTQFDAVIATGSNNSARYFEEYFGQYPHIIRSNRNSIAVLTGKESEEELHHLAKDIFTYYGLGCRSVSLLFVPKSYDFNKLLEILNTYSTVTNNVKYKNNFDYNLTLLLLNKTEFLQGDSILLTEDKSLHSRIGVLHFSYYQTSDDITNYIIEHKNELQVIIGKDFVPFGESQSPAINDFADNVDTMQFLSNL